MEEKLNKLYYECINELKNIKIDLSDESLVGTIDIRLSKRNNKRYGCCRQENPDEKTVYYLRRKKYYEKFKTHHIEISKWVMLLNEDIIKNTIIHELIHCLPNCNNHGKEFKKYAKIINEKLGYNITRLGNKEEDFKKSNLYYKENDYKYKIICSNCKYIYYRQRLARNFLKKYRCGRCKGKLNLMNY